MQKMPGLECKRLPQAVWRRFVKAEDVDLFWIRFLFFLFSFFIQMQFGWKQLRVLGLYTRSMYYVLYLFVTYEVGLVEFW